MSQPERPKYIGARVQRFEDARLLSGEARYIADIRRPNMLHLSFVRAQSAHARITGIDSTTLQGIGFETLVFTGADIGDLAIKAHQDYPEMQYSEQPLLARGRVRFVGEPVAAVLADDPYDAEDAAEQVFVEYDPLAIVATM